MRWLPACFMVKDGVSASFMSFTAFHQLVKDETDKLLPPNALAYSELPHAVKD